MLLRPTCCAGEASASSGTSVACSDKLRESLPFQHRLTGAALVVVHTRNAAATEEMEKLGVALKRRPKTAQA